MVKYRVRRGEVHNSTPMDQNVPEIFDPVGCVINPNTTSPSFPLPKP